MNQTVEIRKSKPVVPQLIPFFWILYFNLLFTFYFYYLFYLYNYYIYYLILLFTLLQVIICNLFLFCIVGG